MTNKPAVEGRRSPRWSFMQKMVIPCENGEQYLVRRRLIQTPWFGIFLHDINSPDSDPHPHNHPWNFASFIVKGGYREVRYDRPHYGLSSNYERWWRVGTWHKVPVTDAHRILEVLPGTISLIFVGPRKQDWGFFGDYGNFVGWKRYESHVRPHT